MRFRPLHTQAVANPAWAGFCFASYSVMFDPKIHIKTRVSPGKHPNSHLCGLHVKAASDQIFFKVANWAGVKEVFSLNLSLPTTPHPPTSEEVHLWFWLSRAPLSVTCKVILPLRTLSTVLFLLSSSPSPLVSDVTSCMVMMGGPGHLWCQQLRRLFNNSRTVISILVIYFSWDLRWLPAMATGLCGRQKHENPPVYPQAWPARST